MGHRSTEAYQRSWPSVVAHALTPARVAETIVDAKAKADSVAPSGCRSGQAPDQSSHSEFLSRYIRPTANLALSGLKVMLKTALPANSLNGC